jgi:23S rRNA pseudouridine1911/1915/1917 synthase
MATPGRESRSAFRLLATGEGASLVECRPETGRTHQLRVHLAHSGHAVVGDKTYGGEPAPRMMLHCRLMAFTGPLRNVSAMAPVDAAFVEVCARYGVKVENLQEGR